MTISMSVLSLGTIFVGYFFSELFLGVGGFFWGNSLFIVPWHYYDVSPLFLAPAIKHVPLILHR